MTPNTDFSTCHEAPELFPVTSKSPVGNREIHEQMMAIEIINFGL